MLERLQESASENHTVAGYINWLLEAYCRVIGIVREESKTKEQTKEMTQTIAVSDGSVLKGEGSAVYVISEVDKDSKVIEGSLAMDSTSENMNLYRAELYRILAVMVIVKILQEKLPTKTMKTAIYCNNEAGVKRSKKIRKYEYPYSIKTANHDKYNVLKSIKELRDSLLGEVKVTWVESHVEHPTCLQELYNNQADKLVCGHRQYTAKKGKGENTNDVRTKSIDSLGGYSLY